jgi:uncharacterized membrane protein YecN with MAPEG domain
MSITIHNDGFTARRSAPLTWGVVAFWAAYFVASVAIIIYEVGRRQ